MPTAMKGSSPAQQCVVDFSNTCITTDPGPAKPAVLSALNKAKENREKGWFWTQGLLYHEPVALKEEGTVPGFPGATYTRLHGEKGIAALLALLKRIAEKKAFFGLDYETGPRKLAPVNQVTGEFDLSKLAYCTETDPKKPGYGSEPYTSTVFLMALAVKKDHAYVVDVREAKRIAGETFAEALAEALLYGRMIAHNAQFEILFSVPLTKCKKYPQGVFGQPGFDTMIGSRLCYAGLPSTESAWSNPAKDPPLFEATMESVLYREMGIVSDKSWQKFFLSMHEDSAMVDGQYAYCAGDVVKLFELSTIITKKLVDQKIYHLWSDFEGPFLPILARAIYVGIPINIDLLIQYRNEAALEAQPLIDAWNKKHPTVSPDSPDQILELFRSRHPEAEIKGTDVENLSLIYENYNDKDAKLLMDLKVVKKVLSTYLDPWVTSTRNPITGRIHASLNQCDTSTGRLNCIAEDMRIQVWDPIEEQTLLVPVKNVKAGDYVWSFEGTPKDDDSVGPGCEVPIGCKVPQYESTSRRIYPKPCRVVNAVCNGRKRVIRLHWQSTNSVPVSGHLDLTEDHRVLTENNGWIPAGELSVGISVRALPEDDSAPYLRTIKRIEVIGGYPFVYDLEIEGTHNFIAETICVHNCKNPNLQNVPSRSKWNKIRSVFCAREGYKIVDRDLSQFEVRALADMAGETHLLGLYKRDEINNDVIAAFVALHPETADDVSKEEWEAVTKLYPEFQPMWDEKTACDVHILNAIATWPEEWAKANQKERKKMRKLVKPVTFAIPYGGSKRTVAESAGVSLDVADMMVKAYKKANAKNWAYLEGQGRNAMSKGVVYSVTGRPRYFPPLPAHFSPEDKERITAGFGRAGMNHPIQSINADVVKLASIMMAPYLYSQGAEFCLWVHDEIMAETPDAVTKQVAEHMAVCLKEAARRCNLNRVPVQTSLEISQNWTH